MKSIVIGAIRSGVHADLFRSLARRWQRHVTHLSDPYRPERHYMRGPGPKWREKHGPLEAERFHQSYGQI